jgi:hypothetical protein
MTGCVLSVHDNETRRLGTRASRRTAWIRQDDMTLPRVSNSAYLGLLI